MATRSWTTTLVTQIKQTKGYKTNMKVCFVGLEQKTHFSADMTDFHLLVDDGTYNSNFFGSAYVKHVNYSFMSSLNKFSGYNPNLVSDEERERISSLEEVKNMPIYANEGAIKIIDGVLVVKLG